MTVIDKTISYKKEISQFSQEFNASVNDFVEYCKLYEQEEKGIESEDRLFLYFHQIQDNLFDNLFSYPDDTIRTLFNKLPVHLWAYNTLRIAFFKVLNKDNSRGNCLHNESIQSAYFALMQSLTQVLITTDWGYMEKKEIITKRWQGKANMGEVVIHLD